MMPHQERQATAPGTRSMDTDHQPKTCPGTSSARGTRHTSSSRRVRNGTTSDASHMTRTRIRTWGQVSQGGGGGGGGSVVGALTLCLYLCVWQVGPVLPCGHNPLRRFQPLSRMLRQDMSTLMGVLRDTNPELYTQVEGEWRTYADCVRQVDTGYFKRSSSSSSASSSSSPSSIATLNRIPKAEGGGGRGEGEGVMVKVERGQDKQATLIGGILGKLQVRSGRREEVKRRAMVAGREAMLFDLLVRALLESPDDEQTNNLGNLDFLKTSALLR